jgi:hypothetical protein
LGGNNESVWSNVPVPFQEIVRLVPEMVGALNFARLTRAFPGGPTPDDLNPPTSGHAFLCFIGLVIRFGTD